MTALVVAACSEFGGEGSPSDAGPPPEVEASTPDVVPSPEGGPADAGDAGEDAAPCLMGVRTHTTSNADAPISSGAATQNRGGVSICNMAVSACVLRFDLNPDEQAAFAQKRVIGLTLALRRADQHVECTGNCATSTFRQGGTLRVRPLVTEWGEGTVTWSTRNGVTPWGMPGALGSSDVAAVAGSLAVPAGTTIASVSVDPTKWTTPFLTGGSIAFRTSFVDAAEAPAAFVAVLRETMQGAVVPSEPPTLTVSYCL